MQIVLVINSYDLGGAEKRAGLVAQLLRERTDLSVRMVAFRATGGLASSLERLGIPCVTVPFSWPQLRHTLVPRLMRLAISVRALRPDVLMSYTVVPNTACSLIWRLTGARTMVWNQTNAGYTKHLEGTQKLAVKLPTHLVSNTQAGAAYLTEVLRAPRQRVRVIRNAAVCNPLGPSRSVMRSQMGIRADAFVGCMVANLRLPKDHATLLRAWRLVVDRLSAEDRSAVLLLAGHDGGLATGLKALAFDLGLQGSVRFLGSIENVDALLQASDIGMLISASESGSNSLLEAMAAGLPVVATDIAGNREVLGEELMDCMVPLGDHVRLANVIVDLALDEALGASAAVRSSERVRASFCPDRMLREILALLAPHPHRG